MSRIQSVLRLTIVLAAFCAGWGLGGAASAQSSKPSESGIEAQRALTAAERVLRDARNARAKVEAEVGERLARLEEQRRNARANPDETKRQAALRAIAAEEKKARAKQAKARAAEADAERNAEAAATALARARAADPPAKSAAPEPVKPPPGAKTIPAPVKPAPAPASAASLEALIHARMDVEAAEAALARAKAARADIERKTGDEVRELARQLADAVELKKRAGDGPKAAEAAALEARLKARIQETTAEASGAETREAEAAAALEAARTRESRARAEIEARLPAR